MHIYCFFCETQKCPVLAVLIERTLGIRCISPQIIQRKWVKGVPEERRHSLLPGYIFLYAEDLISEPIRYPGILRRLGAGNGELENEDRAFAEMLLEHDGILGTLQLVEEGQHCTVADPLWEKMEGQVIKVDRGRKRCCVEFTFDEIRRSIWLGYDLIQPVQNESNKNEVYSE